VPYVCAIAVGEQWDGKGLHYQTLAICRSLTLARAAFAAARHPEGDW